MGNSNERKKEKKKKKMSASARPHFAVNKVRRNKILYNCIIVPQMTSSLDGIFLVLRNVTFCQPIVPFSLSLLVSTPLQRMGAGGGVGACGESCAVLCCAAPVALAGCPFSRSAAARCLLTERADPSLSRLCWLSLSLQSTRPTLPPAHLLCTRCTRIPRLPSTPLRPQSDPAPLPSAPSSRWFDSARTRF